MKSKFSTLTFSFLLMGMISLQAQSKSEVRENRIKSITTFEIKGEKENTEQIESVVVFDTKGNTIEEKEFNSEGELKKHLRYEYDEFSNKLKETELDVNGKVVEMIVYKYEGNLKIERIAYDNKGRIKNKKRYVYTKY